jgi:hypothetical protein
MADFIFNREGRAQGFRLGDLIYDLDGKAVGRISAERVYKLDGSYVGELFKNMVVEKPVGPRRNLAPVNYPGDAKPPASYTNRVPLPYTYADVFHLLSDTAT